MHSDDRNALKQEFIEFLKENGWENYLKKEIHITNKVNWVFKFLHIGSAIIILGLAFAAMREYIERKYGYVALGISVLWLFLERVNLGRFDRMLLKNPQKEIVDKLKKDSALQAKLRIFSQYDMIPEHLHDIVYTELKFNNNDNVVQIVKKALMYLEQTKSLEDTQYERPYIDRLEEIEIEKQKEGGDNSHYLCE